MRMCFPCTGCDKLLVADATAAGQPVQCPNCSTVFAIPEHGLVTRSVDLDDDDGPVLEVELEEIPDAGPVQLPRLADATISEADEPLPMDEVPDLSAPLVGAPKVSVVSFAGSYVVADKPVDNGSSKAEPPVSAKESEASPATDLIPDDLRLAPAEQSTSSRQRRDTWTVDADKRVSRRSADLMPPVEPEPPRPIRCIESEPPGPLPLPDLSRLGSDEFFPISLEIEPTGDVDDVVPIPEDDLVDDVVPIPEDELIVLEDIILEPIPEEADARPKPAHDTVVFEVTTNDVLPESTDPFAHLPPLPPLQG